MRKLLTLCLLLIAITTYSQQRYATIRIKSITPDTLYAGDSVFVDFVWSSPAIMPYVDSSYFNLYDNLYAGNGYKTMWRGKWQTLATFPYVNDSVQRIRLMIPSNADTGHAMIFQDNKQYPLYIKKRTATSIKYNRSEMKIVSTKFYNIGGSELPEPLPNILVIKVEVYEDGSFNTTKSIAVF